MDEQKIINLANKTLDLIALTDIENKKKIEIADLIVEMRKEAINYTLCCKEVETVEVDKEITKSITKLMRSDQFKNPKKKRF